MTLTGKTILITGGTRRIGRLLALSVARAGGNVILHTSQESDATRQTAAEIEQLGASVWIIQADFNRPGEVEGLIERANGMSRLYGVVHNAAIFEPITLLDTRLEDWQRHLNINLTAPFLLSRDFAAQLRDGEKGRIVTILDWRALRPQGDHFPYTITKAALAAMTQSLAVALAPNITVNGIALGAVLPPSTGADTSWVERVVPAKRWAEMDEVGQALIFLLSGPEYITGEILHLDGGRHLV
ncbi:MAG: SDR family oxidoreductase [Chloroflexi bacterium]|nr:SDR family oxidoreductase [Chloroflexota bacterium]